MNKKTLKDFVIAEEQDGLSIDEVVKHGCVSGIVSSLIYYSDTVKFYNEHEEEIWDMLEDHSRNYGSENVLEFIGGFNGAKNVGGLDQFKNLLAWWSVEETCHHLINKREEALGTDFVKEVAEAIS